MSIIKDRINYDELEHELHDALRADELYKLQNDAKFRAIEQAVPTYDHFRAMVDGAHLKSLDRKDMTPKIGVRWNSAASKNISQCNDEYLKARQRTIERISSNDIPRNGYEFRQVWKRMIDDGAKFRLLNTLRPGLRTEIFRSEIPPDMLHDCLRVCLESLKSREDSSPVIEILISLSECNRFQLAVAFMSEREKIVCRDIFDLLRTSCAINEKLEAIKALEKAYVL